ncbi:hypothetical protein [Roseateles albus]|uniref:Uncharacterized protein n=1 Tax=Roseateles albus TaxID=2987525 RepID=A0ABT5KKB4_9BURK|nr:hypothetical protein [Roseateles albus]MDC8773355.1 hypothetical protein [Roseateles albus]
MTNNLTLRIISSISAQVQASLGGDSIKIKGDLSKLSSKLLDQTSHGIRQLCVVLIKLPPEQVLIERVLNIDRASGLAQLELHIVLPVSCLEKIKSAEFLLGIDELMQAISSDRPIGPPIGGEDEPPHLSIGRLMRTTSSNNREMPSGARICCDEWNTEVALPKKIGEEPREPIPDAEGEGVGRVTGSDWYDRTCFVLLKGRRRPIFINYDEEEFGDKVESARKNRHNLYAVKFKTKFPIGKPEYSKMTELLLFQEDMIGDDQ